MVVMLLTLPLLTVEKLFTFNSSMELVHTVSFTHVASLESLITLLHLKITLVN
jgi:hypothetical protein